MCCSGVQGDVGTLRHCEMITTVFLGHPSPQLLIQSPLGGCFELHSSVFLVTLYVMEYGNLILSGSDSEPIHQFPFHTHSKLRQILKTSQKPNEGQSCIF